MSNWANMLFLGDSLTFGSRDKYGLAWPYYMAHIAGEEDYTIIPHIEATPGDPSSALVRKAIPRIVAMPASQNKEVFILIGTNDAKDEIMTPPLLYLQNVRLLVNVCRAVGKRPYVLSIPQPSGFGTPGYSCEINKQIYKYNEALVDAKFDNLIDCSAVRETVDGIHFSTEGNIKLAGIVWIAIKKKRSFT